MALKRTAHKNILFSFAFILTLLIRYLIYLIYLSYQLRKNESERKQTIIGQILSDIDIFKAPQAWPKPEVIYGDLLHKVVLNVGVKVSQLLIQFSAISADSETKPQTFSSLRNNKTNARAETAAGSVAILTQYCSIAYFYTEAYFPISSPTSLSTLTSGNEGRKHTECCGLWLHGCFFMGLMYHTTHYMWLLKASKNAFSLDKFNWITCFGSENSDMIFLTLLSLLLLKIREHSSMSWQAEGFD